MLVFIKRIVFDIQIIIQFMLQNYYLIALRNNHLELAELLINKGADINIIIKYVKDDDGDDENEKDEEVQTPLFYGKPVSELI